MQQNHHGEEKPLISGYRVIDSNIIEEFLSILKNMKFDQNYSTKRLSEDEIIYSQLGISTKNSNLHFLPLKTVELTGSQMIIQMVSLKRPVDIICEINDKYFASSGLTLEQIVEIIIFNLRSVDYLLAKHSNIQSKINFSKSNIEDLSLDVNYRNIYFRLYFSVSSKRVKEKFLDTKYFDNKSCLLTRLGRRSVFLPKVSRMIKNLFETGSNYRNSYIILMNIICRYDTKEIPKIPFTLSILFYHFSQLGIINNLMSTDETIKTLFEFFSKLANNQTSLGTDEDQNIAFECIDCRCEISLKNFQYKLVDKNNMSLKIIQYILQSSCKFYSDDLNLLNDTLSSLNKYTIPIFDFEMVVNDALIVKKQLVELESSGSMVLDFKNEVYSIICSAIKKHINFCYIHFQEDSDDNESSIGFKVYINFYPQIYQNFVLKGPLVDSNESGDFAKYFGNRVQKRLFKDKSICLAINFSSQARKQPLNIPGVIVNHLLLENYGISGQSKNEEVFLKCLKLDTSDIMTKSYYDILKVSVSDLKIKINESSQDLPISISKIVSISSNSKFISIFPPPNNFKQNGIDFKTGKFVFKSKLLHNAPKTVDSVGLLILLHNTSRNSLDFSLTNRLLQYYLLRLSLELKKNFQIKCLKVKNRPILMCFYQGFTFKITAALQNIDINPSLNTTVKCSEIIEGVVTRNPLLGCTIRLVKLWFSANSITLNFFAPEIMIELLVVYFFTQMFDLNSQSPLNMFKLFLMYLSIFNFKKYPLILNTIDRNSHNFSQKGFYENFHRNRNEYPAVCLVVDSKPEVLLYFHVTFAILKRIKQLASYSLTMLDKLPSDSLEMKNIILDSTKLYDKKIFLKSCFVGKKYLNYFNKEQIDLVSGTNSNVCADFDIPSHFIHQINSIYSEYLFLFYNCFADSMIGLVWKPNVKEKPEFQQEIIEQIECIGRGFVKSVV